MARPGRPERNRAARSFRQLRRFHHVINSDKVFGTHNGRAAMRWCVSVGAVLVAGAIVGGDVAGVAAPSLKSRFADTKHNVSAVNVELVIAVDVSYSMDMDELALQREGYAQAIVSKDFLQALRAGPGSKVAVTYFEWSMSGDEKIIIPWRVIDGPESADGVAAGIM